MRWYVEVSPFRSSLAPGQPSAPETFVVEAKTWQTALQSARELMGGGAGPISQFSIELLPEGYRAVDPVAKIRYVIRKALDGTPLSTIGSPQQAPPTQPSATIAATMSESESAPASAAPSQAEATAPSPLVNEAPASASVAEPPPPASQRTTPAMSAPVQSQTQLIDVQVVQASALQAEPVLLAAAGGGGAVAYAAPVAAPAVHAAQSVVAAPAQVAYVAPAPGPVVVAVPAPAPVSAPVASLSAPKLTAPDLPPHEVVMAREESPSETSPLTYREYVYAVPTGTADSDAERLIRALFREIGMQMWALPPGKFVNLAVFDVFFSGRPPRPPLVTLNWKDWRGPEPEMRFPFRERLSAPPPSRASFVPAPPSVPPASLVAMQQAAQHDVAVTSAPEPVAEPVVALAPELAPIAEPVAIAAPEPVVEPGAVVSPEPEAAAEPLVQEPAESEPAVTTVPVVEIAVAQSEQAQQEEPAPDSIVPSRIIDVSVSESAEVLPTQAPIVLATPEPSTVVEELSSTSEAAATLPIIPSSPETTVDIAIVIETPAPVEAAPVVEAAPEVVAAPAIVEAAPVVETAAPEAIVEAAPVVEAAAPEASVEASAPVVEAAAPEVVAAPAIVEAPAVEAVAPEAIVAVVVEAPAAPEPVVEALAEAPAPVVEAPVAVEPAAPEAIAETPAPVVEAPAAVEATIAPEALVEAAPVAEAPAEPEPVAAAPVVETPAVVEAPAPVVETAAAPEVATAIVEASVPAAVEVAATSEALVEAPEAIVAAPAPVVEASAPAPVVEAPSPVEAAATPEAIVEAPAPEPVATAIAEAPAVQAAAPETIAETPAPVVEAPAAVVAAAAQAVVVEVPAVVVETPAAVEAPVVEAAAAPDAVVEAPAAPEPVVAAPVVETPAAVEAPAPVAEAPVAETPAVVAATGSMRDPFALDDERAAPSSSAPDSILDAKGNVPSGRRRLSGDELIGDLFDVMHDLHFSSNPLEAAHFVLSLAVDKLPCQAAICHFYNINRREFVVAHALGPNRDQLVLLRSSENEPLIVQTMRRRKATVINDGSGAGREMLTGARWGLLGLPLQSALIAPVVLGGRFLGLIELINPVDGSSFNEGDGYALSYMGEQLAEFLAQRGLIIDIDAIKAFKPPR